MHVYCVTEGSALQLSRAWWFVLGAPVLGVAPRLCTSSQQLWVCAQAAWCPSEPYRCRVGFRDGTIKGMSPYGEVDAFVVLGAWAGWLELFATVMPVLCCLHPCYPVPPCSSDLLLLPLC